MLGSVVASGPGSHITNSVGYLPYGDTSTATLSGTEFGYAGYRYDAETGLYHTQTRSYDPKTGRFIQPEPIGYGGGLAGPPQLLPAEIRALRLRRESWLFANVMAQRDLDTLSESS